MSFLFVNYFWWLILHSRALTNFQWNVIQNLAWNKNSLPLCNISWFRLPKQTGSMSVCVASIHITSSSFRYQKLKYINDVLDWKCVIFVIWNGHSQHFSKSYNHQKHCNVKNVNPPEKTDNNFISGTIQHHLEISRYCPLWCLGNWLESELQTLPDFLECR